jgi:hypothetical protein
MHPNPDKILAGKSKSGIRQRKTDMQTGQDATKRLLMCHFPVLGECRFPSSAIFSVVQTMTIIVNSLETAQEVFVNDRPTNDVGEHVAICDWILELSELQSVLKCNV